MTTGPWCWLLAILLAVATAAVASQEGSGGGEFQDDTDGTDDAADGTVLLETGGDGGAGGGADQKNSHCSEKEENNQKWLQCNFTQVQHTVHFPGKHHPRVTKEGGLRNIDLREVTKLHLDSTCLTRIRISDIGHVNQLGNESCSFMHEAHIINSVVQKISGAFGSIKISHSNVTQLAGVRREPQAEAQFGSKFLQLTSSYIHKITKDGLVMGPGSPDTNPSQVHHCHVHTVETGGIVVEAGELKMNHVHVQHLHAEAVTVNGSGKITLHHVMLSKVNPKALVVEVGGIMRLENITLKGHETISGATYEADSDNPRLFPLREILHHRKDTGFNWNTFGIVVGVLLLLLMLVIFAGFILYKYTEHNRSFFV